MRLEQLDGMTGNANLFGVEGDPTVPKPLLAELIEYARERATREACIALLRPRELLWCDQMAAQFADSEYAWTATVIVAEGGEPHPYAYGQTPTDAYANMRAILVVR